jgi:non-specific serine/threonine protein kinase
LAIDSNHSRTLDLLSYNYLITGRASEAAALVRRIQQIDPLDGLQHMRVGSWSLFTCRFDSAVVELRQFYNANPASDVAVLFLSSALVSNGQSGEALAVLSNVKDESGDSAALALPTFCRLLKHALQNDKQRSLSLITPGFRQTCWRDCEWSYWVASRLALAGAGSEALDWLENAVHRGFINYPFLECDPFLDNIRREVRFQRLLEWAKHEWEDFEA